MVTRATKNALTTRYSLLPYLYTLFYLAKVNADTVARPLFFEFPGDKATYGPISETQFMWGPGFRIAPVTQAGKTSVNVYLPKGRWYPYQSSFENEKPIESTGQSIVFKAPVDTINTFLRGGNVVPILPPKQTTTAMRKEKFTLVAVLDDNNHAHGQLYWDDGDSIDPVENNAYSLISFEATNVII